MHVPCQMSSSCVMKTLRKTWKKTLSISSSSCRQSHIPCSSSSFCSHCPTVDTQRWSGQVSCTCDMFSSCSHEQELHHSLNLIGRLSEAFLLGEFLELLDKHSKFPSNVFRIIRTAVRFFFRWGDSFCLQGTSSPIVWTVDISFLRKLKLMCVEPLKYARRIECLEIRSFLNHQG